jgi:uncharacterized protein
MNRSATGVGRRLFVDASAYFAVAIAQDASHQQALRLLEVVTNQRLWQLTTNYIVAETHALLLSRRSREVAARFLTEIDQSPTTIVRVSHRDEHRARAIIYQYDDKSFSLTDATSFAVMERLRIPVAFSFDRNFAQYGFQLLGA